MGLRYFHITGLYFLLMKTTSTFTRFRADVVTEELVIALSDENEIEFKPLFDIIHLKLIARKSASGGQEMLRLRAYEKLQSLVSRGIVTKTGKNYAGVASRSAKHSQEVAEFNAGVLLRKQARAATAN
jgi:hypothetical protein